eukprot:TRINITY_DN32_c0_g2_i1.p1 TRINITY_DN32_c0_g2~~TRINITY_DN32_c0_g2_i1.p1  ORF type:complete len:456 (+),score=126.10 TRINITY_DN32_c0_g2_i1:97-1464(+)
MATPPIKLEDELECAQSADTPSPSLQRAMSFLPYKGRTLPTGQVDENDIAREVFVSSPSLPKMMGSLHPAGSLYEKPVNLRLAEMQHKNLCSVLERHGVKVREIHEVLEQDAENSVGARLALEELAACCLTYKVKDAKPETTAAHTATETKASAQVVHKYVSEEYKRLVLECMAVRQLVDIILTHPTVFIEPSYRDTGVTATYTFAPQTNITFTRDQQITTCKGIVMGRLRSEQRVQEGDIMEFCFRKLGYKVIGRVPPPGHLEGGDFFPSGKELCFIGVGLRSDFDAVKYLLNNDLFGTDRVAVVEDNFERSQDRMHLDCVFNIIGHKLCLVLEEIIGDSSPTRRLVSEYVRDSPNSPYKLLRKDIEFATFLKGEGFTIIPVPGEWQLNYGCNMLNLGGGHVIAVHKPTARMIAAHPEFKGDIIHVDLSQITACYGAVHCASQVVHRTPAAPDR